MPLDTTDPDRPKPGKPEVFLRTSANESAATFSPDGRWIGYDSNETPSREIYVRPFAGAGKWQISTGGGANPIWSPAGRQLLYAAQDSRIFVVDYTVEGNSFGHGTPRPWAEKSIVNRNIGGGNTFDVARDGKRVIVIPNPEPAGEPKGNLHVKVLVNFFDEVRRRMPPGCK